MSNNLEAKGLYRVNECYPFTIQGEGTRAGRPASFVRLQGCPVGCPWCDTKYTWYGGGSIMSVKEILSQMQTKYLVITGGEPCIWDLRPLVNYAWVAGFETHLETSGAFPYKGFAMATEDFNQIYPEWTTVSPKRTAPKGPYYVDDSIRRLADEYKFVVDEELTYTDICEFNRFHRPIVLMPEGSPPRPEMVAKTLALLKDAPNDQWVYGDRLQYRIGVK